MKTGLKIAVSVLALAGLIATTAARADNEYKGYTLRVKLIGGVQYEALYTRIPLWEKETGAKVEIVSRKGTNERFGGGPANAGPIVRDLCIENGLMIRAMRDTMVMSPPLVIGNDEIDQMLGIIRKSLDQAQGVLRERFP